MVLTGGWNADDAWPSVRRWTVEYQEFEPTRVPLWMRMAMLISPDQWGTTTVVQEALSEPYDGKLGVAEVVRNRMTRRYSSDGTVAGTVLRASQFSGWNSKDPALLMSARADESTHAVQECVRAWHEAFSHNTNVVEGAVLYHADYVKPDWAERATFIKKIGRHLFYGD